MEKLSAEKQKQYNDTMCEMFREGSNESIKEASVSLQSYTRNKLREESFTEKVFTPIDISNDELHPQEDPELLVRWNDREPDTAPAISVPFGVAPQGFEFKGSRYPSYFYRVFTPYNKKDIDKLRSYTYDIRQVLMDIQVKDMATEIDSNFITTIDSYLGTLNTANPLNQLGLPQYVSISGGITRENIVESFKTIMRLQVPFGAMQPDGSEAKGCILANNVTMQDLLKFGRTEAGGDLSQQMWVDGKPSETVLGVRPVYTIKRDIIPDGVAYLFSSEEFLGKYYRLSPLSVFMESKAFFISWFQWLTLSLSIGNIKGAVKIDFNG